MDLDPVLLCRMRETEEKDVLDGPVRREEELSLDTTSRDEIAAPGQ